MKLLIFYLLLCASCFGKEDPKSFDLSVEITSGNFKIIKNTKNLDVEEIFKVLKVDINRDAIIMVKSGRGPFEIKNIPINNGLVFYKINVIGDQFALFRIKVEDFKKYIHGGSEWTWMPSYYFNSKTGDSMEVIPRRINQAPKQNEEVPA